MSLAESAIKKKTVTYFAAFLMTVGGLAAFTALGQLEDPEFTVKTAIVITTYPGASPEEVELEVTDVVERALQEVKELDYLHSISRAGSSMIFVEIKQKYWANVLPQIWDSVRKKIRNIEDQLPPGAGAPIVKDDFSEVYGFVLAMSGDGYDLLELDRYADAMKKELSLVEGVARCEIWGAPIRTVYIDLSAAQLAELGLSSEAVISVLRQQNFVVDAGSIDVLSHRLRVEPTGEFENPGDIGNLVLRGTLAGAAANLAHLPAPSDLIRLKDVATVTTTYMRPPMTWMRQNGREPALAVHLSPQSGTNVVEVGKAVDRRVQELVTELPVGIEVEKVAWQADLVDESIVGFVVNLVEAVLIVLIVLWITMGLRLAVIIGIGGLVLTILGTLLIMFVWGIDLQRMSLGALIIAMGMMVDNAIVVADGIVVRMRRGMDRTKAAIEAASQPATPLLTATIIASLAFYPIFAAQSDTGEYCRTLFMVVAASLLVSWALSMTVVPLLCIAMLPEPKKAEGDTADEYGGKFYNAFRWLLVGAIRFKVPVLVGMIALFVASMGAFGGVNQMFFPASSRPQLMVDFWAPQGTRIEQVMEDLKPIESKFGEHPLVKSFSTFVGMGPPRFYLPVNPEIVYPEYAQFVVNFESFQDAFAFAADIEPWLNANVPEGLTRVRKYGVGPANTWPIEARFSGPGDADLGTLRSLADQGARILRNSALTREARHNMRQQTPKIVPEYSQERGRWALVTRSDVGQATRRAFDGQLVGLYRQKEDLYPILVRHTAAERAKAAGDLGTLGVLPMLSTDTVPLAQVTRDIRVEWEDPIIRRWDRRRSVRVQCAPRDGVTAPMVLADVRDEFEKIELPPGYTLNWEGEYSDTIVAQKSLGPGLIPAMVIILFLVVWLFNALRPPLIIFATIPFAMIGVTIGFLITQEAFGFLALLGLMSLAGMLIKNAIVLIDEINLQVSQGKDRYTAVVDSTVSRLRPIANAAGTTVLGVIPLLQDPFWVAMAVTIMFGLAFGTVLTLLILPVLYSLFYKLKAVKA
ncbi:MAG: efflux RND transporter permease subunit [Planctomycetota bacterium]